jgi:hypothetical protein
MPGEETVVLRPVSCSSEDACLPGETLIDDLEAGCPESATLRIPVNGGTAPASQFFGIVDHQYGSPGRIQLVLRDLLDPWKQRVLRDLLDRLGVSRELEVPRLEMVSDGVPVRDDQEDDDHDNECRRSDHRSPRASLHRAPRNSVPRNVVALQVPMFTGSKREIEVPCRDVMADGAPVGDERAGDEYGHGSRVSIMTRRARRFI